MAGSTLPYANAYGNITKALEKIQSASTPPRFTQDFLATTLDMPGGSAEARDPLPEADGIPRNGWDADRSLPEIPERSASRGAAAAEALRMGYKPLYEINEYTHDA